MGIEKGTVTGDKKIFTCEDIPYDPLAEKWLRGDEDLDRKVKAKFDQMKAADWFKHLEECKKEQQEADAARAKETARAERRAKEEGNMKGKGPRKRQYESNESSELDTDEEKELRRKLKKKREAREAREKESAGPSRSKSSNTKNFYLSDDLD